MRNLVTDVPGLRVGHAGDGRLASGLTALVFDRPAVASIAIHGGAPGVRDTALLEPEMTVEAVDAVVLSGGSAFGLDGMGGVMAALAVRGRGFAVGCRGAEAAVVVVLAERTQIPAMSRELLLVDRVEVEAGAEIAVGVELGGVAVRHGAEVVRLLAGPNSFSDFGND